MGGVSRQPEGDDSVKVWRHARRSGLALAGVGLLGAIALPGAPTGGAQVIDPTGYPVAIHAGNCPTPNETPAYEVGATLPWGLDETADNEIIGGDVLHVSNTISEPLDNFLQQGQPFAVVVNSPDEDATMVACGDIDNLVVNGQLAIALEPVGGSGVTGIALLDNDAQGFLGLGGDETQVTAYVLAGPGASAPGTATAAPGAAIGTATPAAAGTSTADLAITVEAHDLYFQPNVIVLPADTPVTVTFTNEGEAVHNFSVTDRGNARLENLNIDVTVNPGETKTFTVNAPAGDYYFFCDQPGHEEAGMRGYLRIEDGAAISSSEATVTPRPE